MNHLLRSTLVVALAAAACTLPACTSGDDASSAIIAPQGPPTLSIVSPNDGDCVVLASGEQTALRVTIKTKNWTMRPIGYCGAYLQCGHVVAFADDVRVAEASALVIDVPLTVGDHTVRIELRDDDEVVGKGEDGGLLRAEVKVRAIAPGQSCDADAGTDAASDQ
ncbi:MAG: hypothetical protein HY898_13345 [Deltaproteobacteria bacterium]|nr:hypothetical protein [Deltaproteobacteria bacterium]